MSDTRRFPWAGLGLVLLLIAYVALLSHNFAPAITEPDDNGYFAQGSLLAQTGHTFFETESDAQFIGMHWLVTPKDQYISRYPPGLAVAIAIVYKALGYKASLWVNPALSVLALIAVFLVARRLTSAGWALTATALLAMNPQFVHHALSGDAHIGVTCMIAWTIYFLVRWWQSPSLVSILLAGLCVGCVPTIRYPDVVMAAGVGALLVMVVWSARRGVVSARPSGPPLNEEVADDRLAAARRAGFVDLVAFAIGALIPILPLLIRNQLLLGAFWRTGYALTNEQTGFSWAYFRAHALAYIQSLNAGGVGLLLGLGVVGMVTMICHRASRALGVMLALICLPMLLLYMAYYWAPQMNSSATMRFLLPTFPAYVLAGVWMLATFLKDAPRVTRAAVPLALLVVQGLWGASDLVSETTRIHLGKETLARVTDKLEEIASAGDVVISNNQILQNLDFIRKWKLADKQLLRGSGPGGPGRMNRGIGPDDQDEDRPSPMQQAKRDEQQKKYPGSPFEREEKFAGDVARWAGAHNVYLVGSENEVRDGLGDGLGKVTIIARVTLPEAPAMSGTGGGLMGRGIMPGGGMNRGRPRFGGPMGAGGDPRGGSGPMGGRRPEMGFDGPRGERDIVIAQWTPNSKVSSMMSASR
jgi:hypothetical protein